MICILLFRHLLVWVNCPCNFRDILSIVDSSSLLFENASDERRKRKPILLKINMNLSKNYFLYYDVEFKNLMKLDKDCTNEPFSFFSERYNFIIK